MVYKVLWGVNGSPGEMEPELSEVPEVPGEAAEGGTLVRVTFQKDPERRNKILEGEPKILGVTEIALTIFFLGVKVMRTRHWAEYSVYAALSSVGVVAGGVAIAAQKLHLPTIKACLGTQIVMSVVHGFLFFNIYMIPLQCAVTSHANLTERQTLCETLEHLTYQVTALDQLLEMVQMVVSVTLSAYCCKVVQCCSPRSSLPVITLSAATPTQ